MNSLLKSAILVAFYLTPQVLNCCGQITVLWGPSTEKLSGGSKRVVQRDITCVAEDDGGALVWNYYLDGNLPTEIDKNEFKDISSSTSDSPIIDCALNNYTNCMDDWTTDDWIIANSKEKAMGPVLDKRWEDFGDVNFTDVFVLLNLPTSDAVVFSIRAAGNASLKLCEAQSVVCNETVINETKAQIFAKSKAKGLDVWLQYPYGFTKNKLNIVMQRLAFSTSPMKWRTFILKWSKENKIISLYNGTQLLSNHDYENQTWNSIKFKLDEGNQNLLRFHYYTYLHTTKRGAELISPEWIATRGEVCIEMLVGLCSECQLNITIVDKANNRHPMEPIIPQNNSVGHGLPTWQFVRRSESLKDGFERPVKLEMITSLQRKTSDQDHLWAVANIRKCGRKGALRQSTITARQDFSHNDDTFFWPNITCQKLNYSDNLVVDSFSTTNSIFANNLSPCERGKVGPQCTINCKDVGSDNDCKGLSICYTKGCVCAQGFSGENCTTECNNNKYGFDCTRDCGQCDGETCDRFTGNCTERCTESYLPPLCEIASTNVKNPMASFNWSYPCKTCYKKQQFHFKVTLIKTELKAYASLGESYQSKECSSYKHYTTNFDLLPSTSYKCCVWTTPTGENACSKEIRTKPGMAFKDPLIIPKLDISTIDVLLPSVLYATKDSMMHVIVIGSRPCDSRAQLDSNLIKHVNLTDGQVAWRAASFPTPVGENQLFTIGSNQDDGEGWNCELEPDKMYEIVIVVQGKSDEAKDAFHTIRKNFRTSPLMYNRLCLIVFPTIAIAVLLIIAGYRNRRALLNILNYRNIMRLSRGNSNAHQRLSVVYTDKQPLSHDSKKRDGHEVGPLLRIDRDFDTPVDDGPMNPVKVCDFEKYVKEAFESGLLAEQFMTIPRDQRRPWDYGEMPENALKNRYRNLIAYDATRVVLKKLPNQPYSDYINANYIDGYQKPKAYIATQGPKPRTVVDFWRMIWQEDVRIICMLANVIENGDKKCEPYWPDVKTKMKCGDITIVNIKYRVFMDYTSSTFQISIEHLHYTAWPDHGIPMYTHSLVAYLRTLSSIPTGNGPVVVHCSAGVGRTGTLILCDISLRRAKEEAVIDMFTTTRRMRIQRPNMVDKQQQYFLAHVVVVEALLTASTMLRCNDTLPERIEKIKEQLPLQQERLNETAWQTQVLQPPAKTNSLSQQNLEKNRFPELAPDGANRVYLRKYQNAEADSDYISAVRFDGVKMKQKFLTSQLPLPSTLADFWRMIAQVRAELVVMLQSPEPDDATCCELLTSDKEFTPVSYIKVFKKTETDSDHFSTQTLNLYDASELPIRSQSVTILRCKGWGSGRNGKPPSTETLVSLWGASESISQEGTIAVLCYDGVTGCGLYVALTFLLQRMAVQRECDVCLAIRCIRRSRKQFVQSLEQFEYLHNAAITYHTSTCIPKIEEGIPKDE